MGAYLLALALIQTAPAQGADSQAAFATPRVEALVRRVEHCRLETHPQFFDFFVEGCQFKPVESAHSQQVVSE